MIWGLPLARPSLRQVRDINLPAHSPPNLEWVPTGQRLIDLVYAAGYLDAEGCFRFASGVSVSVTNTYPYTLMFLWETFGGSIRTKSKKENCRTAYEWSANGDNARNCIKLVLPFLREKQPQAQLLNELVRFPARSVRRNKLKQQLNNKKRIDYSTTRMSKETAWMRNERY